MKTAPPANSKPGTTHPVVGWVILLGLAVWIVYEKWDVVYRNVGVDVRAEYCEWQLQKLLEKNLPKLDPKVEKCSPGQGEMVLCFVKALEDGQYKTFPMDWDCKAPDAGLKPAAQTGVEPDGASRRGLTP